MLFPPEQAAAPPRGRGGGARADASGSAHDVHRSSPFSCRLSRGPGSGIPVCRPWQGGACKEVRPDQLRVGAKSAEDDLRGVGDELGNASPEGGKEVGRIRGHASGENRDLDIQHGAEGRDDQRPALDRSLTQRTKDGDRRKPRGSGFGLGGPMDPGERRPAAASARPPTSSSIQAYPSGAADGALPKRPASTRRRPFPRWLVEIAGISSNPASPAMPCAPRCRVPPRIRPSPMLLPRVITAALSCPRAAPSWCSARAARFASLFTATGTLNAVANASRTAPHRRDPEFTLLQNVADAR